MYDIFAYIWLMFVLKVGKYTSPIECLGKEKISGKILSFV